MESGAILKASHNRCDYNADDFCPQNSVFSAEYVTGAHMITAVEQENIFIKGEGIIDGDSHYWMNDSKRFENSITFEPNAERPSQMIFICECKNVKITDVSLRYGSYWHLFLHGCEDVTVRGLNIKGEICQYTNDGIDIDCCRRVTVSDCIIETGDDGLTLRGNNKKLKNKIHCEDVTVSNCIISSYGDYAIRVGVGLAPIKNCIFSNIRIFNSQCGIGMTACFSLYGTSTGTQIENISFNNFSISALRPIDLRLISQDGITLTPPCSINNSSLSDITAEGIRDNHLYGYENGNFPTSA